MVVRSRYFNLIAIVSLLTCITAIAMSVSQTNMVFSQTIRLYAPQRYSFGFDGHAFIFSIEDGPSESKISAGIAQRWNSTVNRNDIFVGHDTKTRNKWGPIYTEDGTSYLLLKVDNGSNWPTSYMTGIFRFVAVSPFIPIPLFAILPAIASCKLLLHLWRSRPGLCRNCSYDLTGNTSGVCPECGITIRSL